MKSMQEIVSYIFGFLLSVILTLLAYIFVLINVNMHYKFLPQIIMIPVILILAMGQLFVQLVFFLHLGKKHTPKWNVFFFISTFLGILLIVLGSIWIMNHLNYNMTPSQVNQYIDNQSGF